MNITYLVAAFACGAVTMGVLMIIIEIVRVLCCKPSLDDARNSTCIRCRTVVYTDFPCSCGSGCKREDCPRAAYDREISVLNDDSEFIRAVDRICAEGAS